MKKLLLLLAILLFIVSCNTKNENLANNNYIPIDTIGKIDIEKMDFEKFDVVGFYKRFDYKDIKTASDTTSDFTRHRFYKKDNFGLPYNLDKINPDYYFPNFEYYTEDEMDELDINFEDSTSTYSKSFPSIAYFKNIEFDYVAFVTKKNETKPIAYLFSTIKNTDSLNFDNKISLIEKKLGAPLSKLRISNGYYTVIKSNTWLINSKYYQFYEDDELNGQRINLLVIDEKDLNTFNKEENMRFSIIHLNERKIKERYVH